MKKKSKKTKPIPRESREQLLAAARKWKEAERQKRIGVVRRQMEDDDINAYLQATGGGL